VKRLATIRRAGFVAENRKTLGKNWGAYLFLKHLDPPEQRGAAFEKEAIRASGWTLWVSWPWPP
jgi:hypothetical protein